MKKLLVSLLLLVTISSMGQGNRSAISDPTLGQIVLTDLSGAPLNPDQLVPGQVIRLKIPVSNLSQDQKIPAGSAIIKIGFGSKMVLDPSFNMNTVGLSNTITWTSAIVGGQLEISGDLSGDMPINTDNITVSFKVKAASLGKSTITANFLVTNHNTGTVLSDANPNNNVSFLSYTVGARTSTPIVKINDIARGACAINVVFGSTEEINLSRYDVEASRDGMSYVKVGEVAASNQASYRTSFALTSNLEARTILVRVRSVDFAGEYKYSVPVSVSGTCEKAQDWTVTVYPNPATDIKAVTISTVAGQFKGKYKLTMFDVSGQMIQLREISLDGVSKFTYNFGTIASGKYLLQLVNVDGSQSATLQFEKVL